MIAYDAYCLFVACHLHFTSETYDCFKFKFKTRTSPESFDRRKDKYLFSKLAKRYSQEHLILFLGDTFFGSQKIWARDILQAQYHEQYLLHQSFRDAFAYKFTEELGKILTKTPNDLLLCTAGYPPLLVHYWQHRISIETLLALDSVMHFLSAWNRQITDPIVWGAFYKRALKYQKFYVPDSTIVKDSIRSVLQSIQ